MTSWTSATHCIKISFLWTTEAQMKREIHFRAPTAYSQAPAVVVFCPRRKLGKDTVSVPSTKLRERPIAILFALTIQVSQSPKAFVRFTDSPTDVTGWHHWSEPVDSTELNGFSRTANNSTREIALVSQTASNLSPSLLSEFDSSLHGRRASHDEVN